MISGRPSIKPNVQYPHAHRLLERKWHTSSTGELIEYTWTMNPRGKLIGVCFLVVLGVLLTYKLFAPPQAMTYFSLVSQAQDSDDEVIRIECSGVVLQVTKTDTAVKGVSPHLGFMGRPPELIDVSLLEGFDGGERIFSVARTPQNWALPKKYRDTNARWLFEFPPTSKAAFVADRQAHDRALQGDRTGEVITLILSPDLPEQLVSDFAKCYSANVERLNLTFGSRVSAFVVPFPSQVHLIPNR